MEPEAEKSTPNFVRIRTERSTLHFSDSALHTELERLGPIMISYQVGDIGTAPMMGPGDIYRLRAADMLDKAEQYERHRKDFENLAMAYLRLAQLADRSAKLGEPLEPDDPAAHQKQQSEQTLQQQQQRPPEEATD